MTASKREAYLAYRGTRTAEQQLYPAADTYYLTHGTWPGDYLQARAETDEAWRAYLAIAHPPPRPEAEAAEAEKTVPEPQAEP